MFLFVVANQYTRVQSDTDFTIGLLILGTCLGSVFVYTLVKKLLR